MKKEAAKQEEKEAVKETKTQELPSVVTYFDKKPAIKAVIDKGKAAGKLSTQDINNIIVETDIDIDDRVTGDDGLGDYDPAEVFSYDSYFTQSYVFMNKITE